MAGGLRHPDWYLISGQKFRRRVAISAVEQVFRGQKWLVLADRVTGQTLRLSRRAAAVWNRLDGQSTAEEVWRDLARSPARAPTQGEMVDWMLQLVSAGLVLSDHDLDPAHLTDRAGRRRDQMAEQRAASPLSVKVALFDPTWLIRVTYPMVRPLFSPWGGLAIAALIGAAIVVALANLGRILTSADTQLLSQSGIVALFLSYPVMKALHEMSHGWAVHHFGGEVREFGVMLLMFVPVPYVDASATSSFADPRARMLVGAAGIVAELVIAGLSLFLWLGIEPGVEKAVLFSFMVMGSLSTLLFNGNPLLKFDAYYVLGDWLEMPNLAARAGQHLGDLTLTRLFGLRPQDAPPRDEAAILFLYGILSLGYRLSLTLVVVLVLSQLFFVLGILLAAWSVASGVVWPLIKLGKRGWGMARRQNRVRRVAGRAAILLVLLGVLGGVVPLPFAAMGEGQIVPATGAELRIGSSGVVEEGAVPDGAVVAAGQPVLSVANPDQSARLSGLRLNVADLGDRLSRGGLSVTDRAETLRALDVARRALADTERDDAARHLTPPLPGQLAWAGGAPPKPGLYVYRGDLLGHVLAPGAVEMVLSFDAPYAGILPQDATVRLHLPDGSDLALPIARLRVLDAGSVVPEPLLASKGGHVAAQADAPDRALAPVMVVWLTPPAEAGRDLTRAIGMRVQARIDLAPRSALGQVLFHINRLFLRASRL